MKNIEKCKCGKDAFWKITEEYLDDLEGVERRCPETDVTKVKYLCMECYYKTLPLREKRLWNQIKKY